MNANSAVNNSPPPIPQPTPTIPIAAIYQMDEDELKTLYRTVKERCARHAIVISHSTAS